MCIASKYGGVVTTLLIEFGERGEILGAEETTARGHHCKKRTIFLFFQHTHKNTIDLLPSLDRKKNAKKLREIKTNSRL